MLTLARAMLSRLTNAVVFVVVILGGMCAGCALVVAENVEWEIKKRIDAHRPANRGRASRQRRIRRAEKTRAVATSLNP
jgi:hypothetical protein